MNTTTPKGIRVDRWISREEYASRGNSWADTASREADPGVQVFVEGIDWRQACKDHGFWGAVDAVKKAHARRLPPLP
jgi:hypothetical protein